MAGKIAVAIAVALTVPPVAGADVGIVKVAPSNARQGDLIRVTVQGYRGMTHQPLPVVMVKRDLAPLPRSCRKGTAICEPSFWPSELRRPRFRVVGSFTRWRPRAAEQGRASITFRLPGVAPGRYVFGLFCPSCARGTKGTLIVADKLVLTVRR